MSLYELLKQMSASKDYENYCDACERQFGSYQALQDHMRDSPRHAIPYCYQCAREFVDHLARQQHWENSPLHYRTYCRLCEINYQSEESLKSHYKHSPAHKDIYCDRCNQSFSNPADLIIHKRTTPSKHHFCGTCKIDYPSRLELIEHWKTHKAHRELYDSLCDIHFDTPTARWTHKLNNPSKHHVCQQCHLDFADRERLVEHWKTGHTDTYDQNCQIMFPSPKAKAEHIQNTPFRHHACKRCNRDFKTLEMLRYHFESTAIHLETYCQECGEDLANFHELEKHCQDLHPKFRCGSCNIKFPTLELLDDHLNTSSAHTDSRCAVCTRGFETPEELKQHAPVHAPKIVSCFGCANKDFPTYSTMLAHLESSECPSKSNIQKVNTMAIKCGSSRSYIIAEREPWLRAGAPPTVVHASDHDQKRNTWKCPVCKGHYLSNAELTRHLEKQECCHGYPAVLQCPDCGAAHTKLSALVEHVETETCAARTEGGPFKELINYLNKEFKSPTVPEGPVRVRYGLRFDPSRPGKLYVKVTEDDP